MACTNLCGPKFHIPDFDLPRNPTKILSSFEFGFGEFFRMFPNSKCGRPWNLFQLEPPWFPWKGWGVEHQTATAQQRHLGEGLGFFNDRFMVKNCWRLRFLSTKLPGDVYQPKQLEISIKPKLCNFLPSFDSLPPGFPWRGAALPTVAPIFSAGDLAEEFGWRENLPVVKGSILTGTRKEGLDIPDASKNYWIPGTSTSPLGESIWRKTSANISTFFLLGNARVSMHA